MNDASFHSSREDVQKERAPSDARSGARGDARGDARSDGKAGEGILTNGALDPAGEATLELFRENSAYSEFLWRRLVSLSPRPFQGRVLEIGCGIGNLTRILLRSSAVTFLQAIDLDPAYVERVEREASDPRLEAVVARADAYCPEAHRSEEGGFDFVVSSNVLEHIEDDVGTLLNVRRMLKKEGVALILVPAHPFLFSTLDQALSHFRRYRRRDIHELARKTGLRVMRLRHFNPVGALGWWLNGKVLRCRALPEGQLSFYNRFAIPISRFLDSVNPFPFGVSLLAVLGPSDQ